MLIRSVWDEWNARPTEEVDGFESETTVKNICLKVRREGKKTAGSALSCILKIELSKRRFFLIGFFSNYLPTYINASPESNLVPAAGLTVTEQGRNNRLEPREGARPCSTQMDVIHLAEQVLD